MGYEYLDHTADIKFRAKGQTLSECFENCAKAMFDSIVDIGSIGVGVKKKLTVRSESLESLLFDFLEELLFFYDAEGLVFRDFDVNVSGLSLTCEATGERKEKYRDQIKTDIKAITYHEMKIEKRQDGYVMQVVLDI